MHLPCSNFHARPESGRRSSVLATLLGSVPDHFAVNGATDAVVQLSVQLGQSVLSVDGCLSEISDGSSLNNVADDKFLDGLVLGHAAGTVGATHGLHMTAALLGTSVVPSLLSLQKA